MLGALPLRNASRLWGYLNSFELPIWFRPYGFRFYAFVFGCNLDEIEHADLTRYASLGDFFYRKLKDGVRPVDNVALVMLRSPLYETRVPTFCTFLGEPGRRESSPLWDDQRLACRTSQRDHLLSRRAPGRRTTHSWHPILYINCRQTSSQPRPLNRRRPRIRKR